MTIHDFKDPALRHAAICLSDAVGRSGLSQDTLDAARRLTRLCGHLGYDGDLLSLLEWRDQAPALEVLQDPMAADSVKQETDPTTEPDTMTLGPRKRSLASNPAGAERASPGRTV